jgi:hypothetical protein
MAFVDMDETKVTYWLRDTPADAVPNGLAVVATALREGDEVTLAGRRLKVFRAAWGALGRCAFAREI